MSVWVQSRNGAERAFKVDFKNEMDFDDLMGAITQKRNFLNLPAGAVQYVHSENSDEERFKLRAGAKVPIPADGQIGSSDDLPYFFSIARTPPGNLFLFGFHVSSCWCSSMSLNFTSMSCCELFGVLISFLLDRCEAC
jgi:hypothetical protein